MAVKELWLGLGDMPTLGCETVMVGTGWATAHPDCIDRLTKHYSHFVGGWFMARKAASALSGCMTTERLTIACLQQWRRVTCTCPVAARLGCERVMAGTGWHAYAWMWNSHGWDRVGHLSPWLHRQAYKKTLSPCRGLIYGKEGCLGSERVYDNQEHWLLRAHYWVGVVKVTSLLIKAGSGSVLESELGDLVH